MVRATGGSKPMGSRAARKPSTVRTESLGPILTIVVACFDEENALPLTIPALLVELDRMVDAGLCSPDSRLLLVDDGSSDDTWQIITSAAAIDSRVLGISLSRNTGFQCALLAGLMEARSCSDVVVSIDADGQDDERAIEAMVRSYRAGSDIVYGVRSSREADTCPKRVAAQAFYRFMQVMGVKTVYNHADFRLMSKRVLDELSCYSEVNLYLRGLIPLIGFPSTEVRYERRARCAGTSHYTWPAMVALALDGITSLTVKPIHMIAAAGALIAALSGIGIIWAIAVMLAGMSVPGWTSIVCIICLIGGLQLFALGLIGEYVGRIYLEVKGRPRYTIVERTGAISRAPAHRGPMARRPRAESCASRSSRP
ncbi:glycosyl transferase family 2 [Coriobacterium glomerans PW2]|uniref:Glycosyl transferase family 2 n=1 Tax=Coriobacterium glomerans (strain ATCC 49209 / DSM 20642 / JCM 10262 / PW2) TaxID=700015 RepID=F2NBN1_CORGP|nr:glycosyltransferase family 2 protein [Coriobacterium glomerans]AEB06840.1 glycosyl transferase family 2 [Coriobacterium glomerans PW2]